VALQLASKIRLKPGPPGPGLVDIVRYIELLGLRGVIHALTDSEKAVEANNTLKLSEEFFSNCARMLAVYLNRSPEDSVEMKVYKEIYEEIRTSRDEFYISRTVPNYAEIFKSSKGS